MAKSTKKQKKKTAAKKSAIVNYKPNQDTALQVAEKKGKELLDSFDYQIEQLSIMAAAEPKESEEKAKEVNALLKKIHKDYQKLAASIERENLKAQTIINGLHNIKNVSGVKKRAYATLSLTGLLADKIPVVSRAKQLVTKGIFGTLHLPHEFTKQYQLVKGITDQLDTLLHNEESAIKQSRNTLMEKMQDMRGDRDKLKKEYEKNERNIEDINKNIADIKQKLAAKYNKPFGKLSATDIKTVDMKQHDKITDLQTEIIKLEEQQQGIRGEVKEICEDLGGIQTNLQTYLLFFIQGEQQYKKMNRFLEHAEPNVGARAAIAQLKTSVVEGAQMFHNFVKNYNEILKTDARHARELAENSDYLVPDKLTSTETMLKVTEDLRDAAAIHIKKDPIDTTKQIQEAFEGSPNLLTENYQRGALSDGSGGGGDGGGDADSSYTNSDE